MKLYFAGDFWDKVLLEEGVTRRLLSFAAIKELKKLGDFEDIFLDSGAFSNSTGADTITVSRYTLWLELYLDANPNINTYAVLDDISDPAITQSNLEYMEAEGLKPLPVYHYGEDTEILTRLCNKYEYIAIGGIASQGLNTEKLRLLWEWIYENYPDNKFHLFGVGNVCALQVYQPYSIDTTLWVNSTKFRIVAGYKDKMPYYFSMSVDNGVYVFFNSEELIRNNIRAMLDWEKLEWLRDVPAPMAAQARLL